MRDFELNLNIPPAFILSTEVTRALKLNMPIVAFESSVVTHGLPFPENLALARDMESEARHQRVAPATIAVLDGKVRVGLDSDQLERLARKEEMLKVSTRDFAPTIAKNLSGGTTVAGSILAANTAGIHVFATGGIGGVHKDVGDHKMSSYDISADLPALARIPMIVVCAGAKAVLDLPATLEYLETLGVPVIGYQTDEFPAFYCRESGLKTSSRANTPVEVVKIARAHWAFGLQSAILVVVPPPEEVALSSESVTEAIHQALQEARDQNISGQQVTPFLLDQVSVLTGGMSLRANLGLLLNNAFVAAQIAQSMMLRSRDFSV